MPSYSTSSKPGPAAARERRQRVHSQARREHVLEAARSAFFDLGLEGASLREIAKRAGYTPGALYSYFDSKEQVYAALLGESLERLNQCVSLACPQPSRAPRRDAAAALHDQARAFFDFYQRHPRDLDLGFYLFHGMQPRGLTPALNEPLNARLRDALAPLQTALCRLGCSDAQAVAEVAALFAHIVGLLVLSHTGRIRLFRQDAATLFERYVAALAGRAGRTSKTTEATA